MDKELLGCSKSVIGKAADVVESVQRRSVSKLHHLGEIAEAEQKGATPTQIAVKEKLYARQRRLDLIKMLRKLFLE